MQAVKGRSSDTQKMGRSNFYFMDRIQRGSKRNFFMVDNGIFDERLKLEPLDKLTYICLLRYADNNSKECFPAMQTVANDIGITRQRVNTAIKRLEEKKLVVKKQRFDKAGSQKSNTYIVFDANEIINRVSTEITPPVNTDYTPCKRGLHQPVNVVDTNYTHLKRLSEEEETLLLISQENIKKLKDQLKEK
jgi:predicted transcriptional regulator